MSGEQDLYAVLGVSPTSEEIVIQAAYRALMRRYHPDTNASPEAALKCVEINSAYAVLGDSAKRAEYDRHRARNGERQSYDSEPREEASTSADNPQAAETYDGDAEQKSKSAGALFAYSCLVLLAAGLVVAAISNSSASPQTSDQLNTSMNVDENMMTTDLDAASSVATDMNASDVTANADEALTNMVVPDLTEPADLSQQAQTPVSYSNLESAVWRFASILNSKGISGARAYSEGCHKRAHSARTWDALDACAAFDYAAAYVDASVAGSSGFGRNGYFEFQQNNQSDNYVAEGASPYLISNRLSQIRRTSESAAGEAIRTQLTRSRKSNSLPETSSAASPDPFANDL